MSMNLTELMPFKKFVQARGLLYYDETIMIDGTYREKETGEIVKGDIFEAHRVGSSLESTYKAYLDWFNHTRYSHEHEREFVSVKEGEG